MVEVMAGIFLSTGCNEMGAGLFDTHLAADRAVTEIKCAPVKRPRFVMEVLMHVSKSIAGAYDGSVKQVGAPNVHWTSPAGGKCDPDYGIQGIFTPRKITKNLATGFTSTGRGPSPTYSGIRADEAPCDGTTILYRHDDPATSPFLVNDRLGHRPAETVLPMSRLHFLGLSRRSNCGVVAGVDFILPGILIGLLRGLLFKSLSSLGLLTFEPEKRIPSAQQVADLGFPLGEHCILLRRLGASHSITRSLPGHSNNKDESNRSKSYSARTEADRPIPSTATHCGRGVSQVSGKACADLSSGQPGGVEGGPPPNQRAGVKIPK